MALEESREEVIVRMTAEMDRTVDKFSQNFPDSPNLIKRAPTAGNARTGEVVLLTGSTGSLGSYLLQDLVNQQSVSHIYALNRPSQKQTLLERQTEALLRRGLDVKILADGGKVTLVENEMTKEYMGLGKEFFEKLSRSVTIIIHNAWLLNFSLPLSVFLPNIHATRNLIDFAIECSLRPTFLYTSTQGISAAWAEDRMVPEEPLPASAACWTGYSASKWVTEAIVHKASEKRNLSVKMVRLGLLSGSSVNGAWNTSDWLPLVVKSALSSHCLPTGNDVVSWHPVDYTSRIIIDILTAPSRQRYEIFHIVNPRVSKWKDIVAVFAQYLTKKTGREIRLVSNQEWTESLGSDFSKSKSDPSIVINNPCIKMYWMWKTTPMVREDPSPWREATGNARMDTHRTEAVSKTMRELRSINKDDILSWMRFWDQMGFFELVSNTKGASKL